VSQEHTHGKYYHGASFPFFGAAFIADTMHLEPEEVGAYTLLLIHSWESYGIPRDLRRVGAITKVPRRRIKAVWGTLASFWTDHPSCELCLVSKRQEEEREKERLRVQYERAILDQERLAADRRRENGRRGGRPSRKNSKPEVSENAQNRAENKTGRLFPLSELETSSPTETPSITSPTSSLRSSSGDASVAPPTDAEPEWQERVRTAARALSKRILETFSPDDRLAAAQYHCLTFGNCTKSEARNKARATQVASAFATMGRHKTYGQITFNEYVSYARQVHKNREATPWFEPWLIKSVVEFAEDRAS
jgi:uncharacterized protein YdaU (DUF1376 family)